MENQVYPSISITVEVVNLCCDNKRIGMLIINAWLCGFVYKILGPSLKMTSQHVSCNIFCDIIVTSVLPWKRHFQNVRKLS